MMLPRISFLIVVALFGRPFDSQAQASSKASQSSHSSSLAAGELFVGEWEWSSGGETFHLTLVRDPAYVSPQFPDAGALNTVFGHYSFTRNGVLVDQSPTTGNRPFALACVPANNQRMRMSFKDNAKDKYAYAILTLVTGQPDTLTWKIEPMEHMYFDGDVIPPPGYTVPNNVTLTRQ